MDLAAYQVRTSIAVSDIARASEFYGGQLGLLPDTEASDGDSRIYPCGGGTSLHVYASPAHAGTATATLATWYLTDLDNVVDSLNAKGDTFEHYDDPNIQTNE